MEDVDEEPEGSGCGGWIVLAAAGAGVGGAVYAYSRDLLVILVWAVGAALLWRAAKKVPGTPDPAPPPAGECHEVAQPQVNVVRDTGHPNRWLIARPSEWLDWTDTEDRDVS